MSCHPASPNNTSVNTITDVYKSIIYSSYHSLTLTHSAYPTQSQHTLAMCLSICHTWHMVLRVWNRHTNVNYWCHSLYFSSHFPGGPGLASIRIWILLELRRWRWWRQLELYHATVGHSQGRNQRRSRSKGVTSSRRDDLYISLVVALRTDWSQRCWNVNCSWMTASKMVSKANSGINLR